MSEKVFKSLKSRSEFIVSGEKGRAYLSVTGEAATNPKVLKEVARIRREGADIATAEYIARQLSNTY